MVLLYTNTRLLSEERGAVPNDADRGCEEDSIEMTLKDGKTSA